MAYISDCRLTVGVSSRALFDLEKEYGIWEREGMEAYCRYQLAHENEILKPGPGFSLVRALLAFNRLDDSSKPVEVVLISRNPAEASLRLFDSISYYELGIRRAVLSGGSPLAPYLKAVGVDLFLSANEEDVKGAAALKIAAGLICTGHGYQTQHCEFPKQLRIAFDADAVVFSDEAQQVFAREGLDAFEEYEMARADKPLQEGPFALFLKALSSLQKAFAEPVAPLRIALVTARCAPAHERVVRTLRAWDVRIDEYFFLGGLPKRDVLAAFGAQIFFDDQDTNIKEAAEAVPAALVQTA